MAFFDNQLDSDETIVYRCRPSRKAFLGEYLFIVLIIIAILVLLGYRLMFWLNTAYGVAHSLDLLIYFLALVALILLVKVEYKIWSVRYALTSERIMYSKGILSENFRSTLYSKITDIGLQQTFFERIMDTGTILLDTAGEDDIELIFEKISRPLEVKRMISDKQTEKVVPADIPRRKTLKRR